MYAGTENVAYDLARFDNRTRVKKAAELTPLPTVERKKEAKRGKRGYKLAAFRATFMLLIAAVVLYTIVYNYMRLTELTYEEATLKKQLAEYKNEEVLLRTEQERVYNLAEIEQYVQNNLDMVQLDRSRIEYVELSNPDKVVRAGATDGDSSYFLSGLAKSFSAVLEYLS